jgi:hypothetical protein
LNIGSVKTDLGFQAIFTEYGNGCLEKQPKRASQVAERWASLRDRDCAFKTVGLRAYADGSSANEETGR